MARHGPRQRAQRNIDARQTVSSDPQSKDDEARIDACTDLATLERWLDRAITAVSVADVLG